MLGTLIKKEVQSGLFSFRFLMIFALLIIVVPVTIFILTNDYVKKVDEYSFRQAGLEDFLRQYAHFNRLRGVIDPAQPPLPAYALVRGVSSDVNSEAFDNDPLPVMFPLPDLIFIVAILLSLAALIFSYDAVCGEKEDGTLRLMLANGLPRVKILFSKIVGSTLTLLVPFLVSLVLGLLVIMLNPRVAWAGTNWASLALILLGAVVYILFFQTLGVLISARHHSSAASIMTSLCVWALLLLVVPNLSPYLASLVSPVPSRIKISREVSRLLDTDRDDLGQRLQTERLKELVKKYPALAERLSEAEAKARTAKDPAYREAVQAKTREVQAAWDEANRIQKGKADVLEKDIERKVEAQTRLSGLFSMASPLSDFTYMATDLTSTGKMNIQQFKKLSDVWESAYGEYSRGRIAALQKKEPAVDWWNTPVDVSDMPRFQYQEEALAARIKGTLWPFAALIFMNLLVFGGAYLSFVRYDVR